MPVHCCSFCSFRPSDGLLLRKYKLPNQQNGQIYLTSHRICYVDRTDPRKYSVALDLRDVERYEHYVRKEATGVVEESADARLDRQGS